MPRSHCHLFKRSFEFVPISEIGTLPARMRGIYVLYQEEADKAMNVLYVGMARGENSGAKGRLIQHKKHKADLWSHCSVFEVWDNIFPQQIEELEGLFRHLYRLDESANKLNKQKGYAPLARLRRETRKEVEASKF